MGVLFATTVHWSSAVRFAASPLLEALLSLHVLVGPQHHPVQAPWVRAARGFSPRLRRDIATFSFAYRHSYPCCVFPSPSQPRRAFEAELATLRALAEEHVPFEFGLSLAGSPTPRDSEEARGPAARARMREGISLLDDDSRHAATLLLDRPAEFVDSFATFLGRYWNEAFAEEWARIEPLIKQTIIDGAEQLARGGLDALLEPFHPHVDSDTATGRIIVRAEEDRTVEIDTDNPLLLCPSMYIWPHMGVNRHAPFSWGLLYPAPAVREVAEPRRPSAELVAQMQALGDVTRLNILGLVSQQPRSTQELAALLHMSEAGVSKHIRQLARAGLVTSMRDGYYVLYSADAANVSARLSRALAVHFDAGATAVHDSGS